MYRVFCILGLVLAFVTVSAVAQPGRCENVGGVLMTNIGTMPDGTNLGPVYGDLAGSVAATLVGPGFTFQHYWVTSTGETILFAKAVLTPVWVVDNSVPPNSVVSVLWNNYGSDITGGTGKFAGATGHLDYFGIADFNNATLVLRYRGQVCYKNPQATK